MNPRRLLLLATLAACGSNPTPGAAPTTSAGLQPNCAGSQSVEVTNDWTGAVDIYAAVADEAQPRNIGRLLQGNRLEIPVPAGATRVYALQAGYDEANAATVQVRKYVRFRYTCR